MELITLILHSPKELRNQGFGRYWTKMDINNWDKVMGSVHSHFIWRNRWTEAHPSDHLSLSIAALTANYPIF